ncbi:unnamed protein product, partial [Didymodactylos carnosus]
FDRTEKRQQKHRRDSTTSGNDTEEQQNQNSSPASDIKRTSYEKMSTSVQPTINFEEFDKQFLQRYLSPTSSNVIVVLLICDKPSDLFITHFRRQALEIKDSRLVYTILYRSHSPIWLDLLRENIEDSNYRNLMTFAQSTVIALYLRRRYFVPYLSFQTIKHRNSLTDDDTDETQTAFLGFDNNEKTRTSSSSSSSSSSDNSFSDFLSLLLDGIIRSPIYVKEWPLRFKE